MVQAFCRMPCPVPVHTLQRVNLPFTHGFGRLSRLHSTLGYCVNYYAKLAGSGTAFQKRTVERGTNDACNRLGFASFQLTNKMQ